MARIAIPLLLCVIRCSAISLRKPRRAKQQLAESVDKKLLSDAAAMQSFYGSTVFDWQTVAFLKGGPVATDKKASLLSIVVVPSLAIIVGAVLYSNKATADVGMFITFFGAQCFMTLYMKSVISETPVSAKQGMYGFPAPFVVTGLQMITSFACICMVILATWFTPWAYTPKPIEKKDVPAILCLACTFAANISLNNMSLTMIDISINQVVRSGGPIAILVVSGLMAVLMGRSMKRYQPMSYVFLIGSMIFAALTILQKSDGAGSSPMLIPGVLCCCCSLLASAANMLVVAFLGTDCKLNPIDSLFYMSLPSALLLVLPAYCISHKVPWGQTTTFTDIEILRIIWSTRPLLVGLSCLSGLFALVYNFLMYNIVQTMSAMAIEVASNANKAAIISLALGLGMESLPAHGSWKLIVCIASNIACVTLFSTTEKMAELRAKNDVEPRAKNGSMERKASS